MISTDTYPARPGFKADGTSAEAADSVRRDAVTLRAECLALLKRKDLTADEAADQLHESVLSIRPRFSELSMRREIRDSGERRKNCSGTRAIVWTTRFEAVQPELI